MAASWDVVGFGGSATIWWSSGGRRGGGGRRREAVGNWEAIALWDSNPSGGRGEEPAVSLLVV